MNSCEKLGIINFSNNCYLNVIIQLFLCNKYTSNIIIHYLEILDKKIINPEKLIKKLKSKIDITIENDSQEVFMHILDLIPELEKYYKNSIKNFYTCQECNKCRTIEDTFTTFYIHSSSLEDSIKQLLKKEMFSLECENCKKNTITNKTCKINKLGKVLIFFNIVKNNLIINNNIKFGTSNYKLTGIIKHYGDQNNGHYVFIDFINKLLIDDTSVTQLENIPNDNIYLLFYTC